MTEFRKRIGETHSPTATELETNAKKYKKVVSLQARGQVREWQEKQKNYIRDSRALMTDMRNALTKSNFVNKTAFKSRITQLIDIQSRNQETIKNLTSQYAQSFEYSTEGGKPSRVTEAKIRLIVNARIRPAQTRAYNNAVTSLNSVKTEFNSIDSQIS